MIRIPITGQVSAGSPLDWIPIKKWRWIRPLRDNPTSEKLYGMEVVGDSLIDNNILSGDILIYNADCQCRPGDLCVIQTPHGVTAKYVFPRGDEGDIL
jgi:SOS-response transcriptional repressor LexA